MKTITLDNGMKTIVDDDVYEWAGKYRWQARQGRKDKRNWYATNTKLGQQLHRMVAKAPIGLEVDHINHDSLDNRRENLRLATTQENQRNQRKQLRRTHSKFKGVTWIKTTAKKCWVCQIKHNGVIYYLGTFLTEVEAARRYNEEAFKIDPIFYHLNDLGAP